MELQLQSPNLQSFVDDFIVQEFVLLPITLDDAIYVERLPQLKHKDPFDRLIAVQAIRMRLPLVSADRAFDAYGIQRIW